MAWSIPRGNVKHSRRQMRSQNTLETRLKYIEGLTGGGVSAFTVAEVDADYTMLATDAFVRLKSTAGGNKTITLHATPTPQVFYFRNDTSLYDMILNPDGAVQIDGTTSITIQKAFRQIVVWSGTAYFSVCPAG